MLRRLAAEARAAGRDPATDPIPGLRRDVLFAVDRRRGGRRHPRRRLDRRAAARAAPGGRRAQRVRRRVGGLRRPAVLPDRRGREGLRQRTGSWSTARGATARCPAPTMPRSAPRPIVTRARRAGPGSADPGDGHVLRRGRRRARRTDRRPRPTDRLARRRARARRRSPPSATRCTAGPSAPSCADTASPNVIQAGVKYNVIPGVAEIVEVDCRTLPGTDETAMRAELRRRVGDELWTHCDVEVLRARCRPSTRRSTRSSTGRSRRRSATTIRTASRSRSWSRSPRTPSTRSGWASRPTASRHSGSSPTSGSSSGSTASTSGSGVDALRFGLPVLYDVVRRFCG